MSNPNTVVAIFDSQAQTEAAVRQLQSGGIDLQDISVIGQAQFVEQPLPDTDTTGRSVLNAAKKGVLCGGLGGLLIGVGLFSIPGFGAILVAGQLLSVTAVMLESAIVVGGLSAVGAMLVNVGIFDEHQAFYENAIRAGKVLLICHEAGARLDQIRGLLEQSHATLIRVFQEDPESVEIS